MKTFKEYYDGLNAKNQKWIQIHCNQWFSPNEPDYYKNKDMLGNQDYLKYITSDLNRMRCYKSDLSFIAYIRKLDPSFMSDETYDNLLNKIIGRDSDLVIFMDIDKRREYFKNNYNLDKDSATPVYCLKHWLFITEDFDNLDISTILPSELRDLCIDIIDMFGHKIARELIKEDQTILKLKCKDINNDMFDDLFFGEDGWTDYQKSRFVQSYNADTDAIEDFMRRIVTVDPYYLRYLGTIIDKNAAIASELYKLKKDPSELTGEEKIEMQYRYPKAYRKLFQIAGCCSRKNLGKAMTGTIGDNAAILRFYNFDYSKIFMCLYPEHADRMVEADGTA